MTHLRHASVLRTLGVAIGLPAALALFACAGTDTGNPIGDGDPSGDEGVEGVEQLGGDCELIATELAWESAWNDQFSAADVVAHLPENLQTTLRWLEAPQLAYGPESGLGEVEISIEPTGRAFALAPKSSDDPLDDGPTPEGPVQALDESCGRRLRVEAMVTLTTPGGALGDSFVSGLDVLAFEDTVHTHFRVPAENLTGDLELDLELGEGQSLASPLALEVELWLGPAGLTGALRLAPTVLDDSGNSVETPAIELARFPAEQPCGMGGFELEPGETLHGFSPDQVLQKLTSVSASEWVYEHQGGTTELSWTFPDPPTSRCVGAEQVGTAFLTTLALEAGDGSIGGSFIVNVHAEGDGEGGFWALQMAGGSYEQDIEAAQDLGERYGLTDPAPLAGFDGGMTDFIVDATMEPWGVFHYAGLTQDPCVANENCQGLVPTLLFGARLGEPKNGYELAPPAP